MNVQASAPGKLVLSGEYAVLLGAPALVAAVDRRVSCTLKPRQRGGWRFVGKGFRQDVKLAKADVFQAPPSTTPGLVRQAIAEGSAPEHLHVQVDSSACYQDGEKLGVGSSAATVVAVAGALGALVGEPPGLASLYAMHARMQGGGSGLDIAAAATGGVIRFQSRNVSPVRLPDGLGKTFVFAGSSTRTAGLVDRFQAWRGGGTPPALERLIAAAFEMADCTVNAETFVDALGEYADVLEHFDHTARIGIFGPGHRMARELARQHGVVYKPCGAGGGDTGVAIGRREDGLAAFADDAGRRGLKIVPMEISPDGLAVRTG